MKYLKVLILIIGLIIAETVLCGEEKDVAMTSDDIKKLLTLSVYLQSGYTYNLTNPDLKKNELRVFDHMANSFTLDLVQLVFTKEADIGEGGFKLKISAGETAKLIHSQGLGTSDDVIDLTEAYVSYVAPVGKGLRFDFGKYVTFHGAEVIEAKDNPNYSRSFLFNYAIPFTHTGLKIAYPFSDALNVSVHIVNGWDNTADNNKGKTVGLNLNYMPFEQIALTFNFMYGPEQDENNSNKRFLFDWVGTLKPIKNLSFILNADYGREQKVALDATDAEWYGMAAIVKYDFNKFCSFSVRTEYFKDSKGVRTGTPQTLKEVTLTPEFRITKSLILRLEYRHDWSDKEVFDSGRSKSQDTIAFGVMYSW